ncbi:MAG TPA: DUF2304 family protein [Candidatus Acidoferrales bacterium]|nr:DUF2304 family protein [Candidatus Acidoferrales bacterium]
MSTVAVQSALVALGGVGLLAIVFVLARRRLLSLRYALGWMAISLLLVLAAIVLLLIGGISPSLPVTPTGLLAGVGLAFLLVIALQLSISLSGQQESIRELSEANALLGERLQRAEAELRSADRELDGRELDGREAPARNSTGRAARRSRGIEV